MAAPGTIPSSQDIPLNLENPYKIRYSGIPYTRAGLPIGPDPANSLVVRNRLRRVLTALDKLPPQARKIMMKSRIQWNAKSVPVRLRAGSKRIQGARWGRLNPSKMNAPKAA
jgi:hypothetical protein